MKPKEKFAFDRARLLAQRYILREDADMQSIGAARYLLLTIQHLTKRGYLYEAHRLSELNDLLLTKLQQNA